MIDANELMKQLEISKKDPKVANAIKNLQSAMGSAGAKSLASNISEDTAKQIQKAAQAMKNGDKQSAQMALNQILSTSEGKNLAMQLKNLMGK